MHRRNFLKLAGAASVVLMAPEVMAAPGRRERTLVLIELQGGNDGLNTVIPYADPDYYRLRPNLAIGRGQVLQVSDTLGLHPALAPLMKLWKGEEMAIISGVGYPEPNRSHFRSIEIWETASASDEVLGDGWLALARKGDTRRVTADGIVVGDNDVGPLSGANTRALLMNSPEQFIREARMIKASSVKEGRKTNGALRHVLGIQKDLADSADDLEMFLKKKPALGSAFPDTAIGRNLATVARLIISGVAVPVMKVSLGGFDTHANQRKAHDKLQAELAGALAVFHAALAKAGRWDDTLVMTYSEFGRRVAENGSRGTDHGTAAPHFMFGGRVRGGLYGRQPSLSDLNGGDLKHHVDFRQMYNTVARSWWGRSRGAVGGQYKVIPCLKG